VERGPAFDQHIHARAVRSLGDDYGLLCLGALLDLEVSQEFAEPLHVSNFGMCRM